MNTEDSQSGGGWKVVVAWAVLALQIIGLLLLLVVGPERLSAMTGSRTAPEVAAQATTVPAATAEPTVAQPTDVPAPTDEPALSEEPADLTDVLTPEDVTVNPTGMVPDWLAQVIEGTSPNSGSQSGLPPHLLLTFSDPDNVQIEAATPDVIDLSQPQIRIVPISALLAMLQAQGDAGAQEALEQLQSLLQEQPPADGANIPTPPLLAGASQNFVARVEYEGFQGGSGVGYITNITGENILPVTNESGLNYVFQGVTADGTQYVLMTWPVAAAFLPNAVADVTEEIRSAVTTDPAGYVAGLDEAAEAAPNATYRPNLARIAAMLGTLAVGREAMDVAGQAQPDPVGTVWAWGGGTAADGSEVTVENPDDYLLTLWPDGTFSVKADCNVGSGTYTYGDDGAVQLTLGPLTRALCPPESQDAAFLAALGAAQSLSFADDGQLVLTAADGSTATFTNSGPADTGEAAASAEQSAAVDGGLTGVAWQWPGYTNAAGETITVENPEDYELALSPDGTFTFKADCNVGRGTYTYAADGALQLLLGPMTLAACPPESQSDAFLAFLSNVNGATIADDGSVTLTTADGASSTLVRGAEVTDGMEVAPDDGLIGTVWQWTRFDDSAEENDITVPDPESYLLVFLPDGAYSIKADCNVGRGGWTRDGASLSLTPGPLTRALCPPESLSDQYVSRLSQTVTYVITEEGELALNLFADSGNMVFANGGPADIPAEESAAETQPAAEGAGLTGLELQWPGYTDAAGNVVTVPNPQDYGLVLFPDGTFTVKADCNVGSGTYTYGEDGAIALDLGPLTRASCPPDSQSDAFLAFLEGVSGAAVDEAGNVVLTTADGATSTMPMLEPVAVPEGQAAEGELTGIVWQWTGFTEPSGAGDLTVDEPESYTILFNPDGSYGLRADCNVGGGTYTADGSQLSILPGPMTLVACEPPTLDMRFLGFLGQVASYGLDSNGNLLLNLADDAGTMTFANGGAPEPQVTPVENIVWQWSSYTDASGARQEVAVPESYYLTLLDDGTYVFRADCNNGTGAYTSENGLLTLLPGPITLAACPEGSLSDQFVQSLGQVSAYGFDGEGNLVFALSEGGSLTFTNAGPFEGVDTGVGGGVGETATTSNALADTSWQWVNFRDAKQDYAVPDPASYVVTFNADGSLNVVADCNTGGGTYTVDGDTLTISPLATTLVACAEGSLGDSFLQYLTFAGTFAVEGTVLRIELMADGGSMTFNAAP